MSTYTRFLKIEKQISWTFSVYMSTYTRFFQTLFEILYMSTYTRVTYIQSTYCNVIYRLLKVPPIYPTKGGGKGVFLPRLHTPPP